MSKLFPQLSKYVAKFKISKRPPAPRKLFILLFFTLASIYFLCFSSFSGGGGGSNNGMSNSGIEGPSDNDGIVDGNNNGGGFFGGGSGAVGGGDYFSSNSDGNKGHYLPGCVIIGVRKCGTRALIDMLNLHPQVEKSPLEIHFFDRDENYIKGLEWYASQMPETLLNQIAIEKSPSYFVTPEVPERIYEMNSSIKLLLIVREPVTRVISDYTQIYLQQSPPPQPSSPGNKDVQLLPSSSSSSATSSSSSSSLSNTTTITASVNNYNLQQQQYQVQQPSLEELVLTPSGHVNTNYKAIRISMYSRYMRRWLDVFPKEQIHVIDGDALIRDPYNVLRDVEKFLGLEHKLERDYFYFNNTKGFYCWRSSNKLIHCLNDSKGRRHPVVKVGLIRTLRQFYRKVNYEFYEMVGRDFGWPEN